MSGSEESVDSYIHIKTGGTFHAIATDVAPDLGDALENAPEAPIMEIFDANSKSDAAETGMGQRDEPRSSGGGRGKRRGRKRGEIFDNSPVTPLGIHGDISFYLDTKGQLRSVDNHTLQKMLHVFGGQTGLLAKHFPVLDKEGDPRPNRFDQMKLSTAMIAATTERGVWSPTGRVRGAGAWTDDDGQLIFHAGDKLLIDGNWLNPGVFDSKVYPASDPIPRPSRTPSIATSAEQIMSLAETWNWRRPDVDPMLVLGAICAQMIGGALDWRPVTWLTGDQATGKSTFQKMLRYVHGGSSGLLQASDATEAGIRSIIGYSSMPVALDELEPDDDPKKGKSAAIIRLARIAASGDQILRGSTDQKGYQGNAYSCFLFSSILIPPLPPQDRSRLIMLDLDQLPADAPKVALDPRRLKKVGAALRRRLIDGWVNWPERLELWRAALARHGHGGRHADNYGTVLGLADMALRDELPSKAELDSWCKKLDVHLREETVDVGSNAEDMMVHLLSQPLDVWRRGQRVNVATWLAMAAKLDGARDAIESADHVSANSFLAQYGLRVKGRGLDAQLAIANKPISGLASLFDGTPWASGVWSQAARRVKGAKSINTTFARVPSRAYYIPFTSIPGLLNAMDGGKQVTTGPPRNPDDMEEFV